MKGEARRRDRHPRISGDDIACVFGNIGIVLDHYGRFRAVYVFSPGLGAGGVISSLDPDAGRWYVDELGFDGHFRSNCSRSGHRTCENAGVSPSEEMIKLRMSIRQRQRKIRVRREQALGPSHRPALPSPDVRRFHP